jgi:hypothetical protein
MSNSTVLNFIIATLFSNLTTNFARQIAQGSKKKASEADDLWAMIFGVAPYLIIGIVLRLVSPKDPTFFEGELTTVSSIVLTDPLVVNSRLCNTKVLKPADSSEIANDYVCGQVRINDIIYGLTVPSTAKPGDKMIFRKNGTKYELALGMSEVPINPLVKWSNIMFATAIISAASYLFSHFFKYMFKGAVSKKIDEIKESTGFNSLKSKLSSTPGSRRSSVSNLTDIMSTNGSDRDLLNESPFSSQNTSARSMASDMTPEAKALLKKNLRANGIELG